MSEPSPKWLEKGYAAAEEFLVAAGEREPTYRPVSPEARYYEAARELRRDFMREFYRHGVVTAETPWVLFGKSDTDEGDTLSRKDDILRFMWLGGSRAFTTIRFTSSELMYSHGETSRYLTCEFTLDGNDRACYTWNMFEVFDDERAKFVAPSEAPDGTIRGGVSTSIAVHMNKSGRLELNNVSPQTRPRTAGSIVSRADQPVIPFGTPDAHADRVHALNVGRGLLASVQGQTPMATAE